MLEIAHPKQLSKREKVTLKNKEKPVAGDFSYIFLLSLLENA